MTDPLTLVVPAYNEARSLRDFLPNLLEYCEREGWRVIVVDDGSTDATQQLLGEYELCGRLQVLQHKLNRGYRAALKSGISHAETEFVITVDADGQHRLCDVAELLEVIQSNDADMVIGRRDEQGRGSMYRTLGRWLIRRITKILVPSTVKDINSGMKIYRTSLARGYIRLCPNSMAFSDIIALVFLSERRLVLEHPVVVEPRATGRSTINTLTAFETLLEILHIIMLFNPMRLFLPVSMLCVLGGITWALPIIWMGRGVSVGALMAILSGLGAFALGLAAEQLALLRKHICIDAEYDHGAVPSAGCGIPSGPCKSSFDPADAARGDVVEESPAPSLLGERATNVNRTGGG